MRSNRHLHDRSPLDEDATAEIVSLELDKRVVGPSETVRPSPETLELVYDEVQRALDKQFTTVEHLNGRPPHIIGFGGATMIGLVLALRTPNAHLAALLLTLGAVLIYAAVVLMALRAWSIEAWRSDPQPRTLWEKHGNREIEWVRHQVVHNRLASRDANATAIDRKVKRLRWAYKLFALEIVYVAVLLILRPYI
jgi:pimeloyl-ACP methyl ester carboxylesterase